MSNWRDRIDELLYRGETVSGDYEVGSATIVVTSHRIMTFTPESEDTNYSYIDRPNVDGVEITAGGDPGHLSTATRAAGYGAVMFLSGVFLPLDSVLGDVTLPKWAGQLGLGGIFDLFERMMGVIRNLDDLLITLGTLALVFAFVPLGVYLWDREQSLVIRVAGEDNEDIYVPTDDDADEVAEEIETQVFSTQRTKPTGGAPSWSTRG